MKTYKIIILAITLAIGYNVPLIAQESTSESEQTIDKKTYYEQRAKEDAKFEQQFKAESKDEEEQFWEDQKDYEKELKRRDRAAYRAYMQGKRDAYAEHYNHCNSHCHHNEYYYYHASYYHHGYRTYYYERYPRRSTTISTGVRINTPRVKIGF
ncbi:hypothetical protein [Winogradskyella sp. A3E31]|uniref:hypothetical protein n=1 Tax=Winogradskyella sp. A3E31 TaxID=3349637 RepID=UPI00398A8155